MTPTLRFRSRFVVLLAAVLPLPLLAQGAPKTTIRRNVNEVMVDLVVTNQHGQIIKNLQPSDLEVLDNGQPQKIDSFRLVSRSVHVPPADLERAGLSTAVLPQPFNLVFFVYEGVGAGDRQLAQQASQYFLQHDFSPADYGAVFRVDQVLYALSPLTHDKAALAQAIHVAIAGTAAEYRATSLTAQQEANQAQQDQQQAMSMAQQAELPAAAAAGPGTAASAVTDGIFAQIILQSLEESAAMAGEQQSWQSLTALRSLVDALGRLPGRKEILYFNPWLSINTNTVFEFRALVRDANRNHVTFYAIDPSGLRLQSSTSNITNTLQQAMGTASQQVMAGGRGAISYGEANLGESEENVAYASGLKNMGQLAVATGGFLASGTNDLDGFMTSIADDMNSHYELTYQPTTRGVNGYHTIAVKVIGHPKWIIRERKGYYAIPLLATPARGYEVPLLAELSVQPPPRQLSASSAAYAFPDGKPLTPVRLETRVPLRDIAATPVTAAIVKRDSKLKGKDLVRFTVLQVIKDADGRVLENYSHPFGFSVPPSGLAKFRQHLAPPFVHFTRLPPGQYTVQTVVYQADPKKVSVLSRPLTVPAASKVGLSSVLLLEGAVAARKGATGYDPLRYQDHQLIPNLTGQLAASDNPKATVGFYFIAAVPPGTSGATVSMSFAKDGATFVRTPPTPLPDPDAQGRIPFVANIPLRIFPAGKYQVTVQVQAAGAQANSRADFTTVSTTASGS